MDVVRRIASSLRRRLPPGRAELEELEADGFEALVRALRVYHSSKGPLIPYIVLRNQPMYLLLQMWVGDGRAILTRRHRTSSRRRLTT